MADVYVVIVEGNLVRAIERCAEAPDGPIPRTPLEVSTELANNHRRNGRLDGRYYFTETQPAKIFAALCLGFVKSLAERRIAAIDALPVGSAVYKADDERDAAGPGPG